VKPKASHKHDQYEGQVVHTHASTTIATAHSPDDSFVPHTLTLDNETQRSSSSKPPIVPPAMNRRLAELKRNRSFTRVQVLSLSTAQSKDSLSFNDDDDNDDDEVDSEIERITKLGQHADESKQGIAFHDFNNSERPSSRMLRNYQYATNINTDVPWIGRSDSDNDDDEFIRMLKRK
jgi:hypothetical protein